MMKVKFLIFALISGLTLTSCAQQKAEQAKSPQLIESQELNNINNNIQLIDVRTPEEFQAGHLNNAVNINFYDDNFLEQFDQIDQSKPVYVYCKKGGRSAKAAEKLSAKGFQVYDLKGGYTAWIEAGMPTVK